MEWGSLGYKEVQRMAEDQRAITVGEGGTLHLHSLLLPSDPLPLIGQAQGQKSNSI